MRIEFKYRLSVAKVQVAHVGLSTGEFKDLFQVTSQGWKANMDVVLSLDGLSLVYSDMGRGLRSHEMTNPLKVDKTDFMLLDGCLQQITMSPVQTDQNVFFLDLVLSKGISK